MPGSSRGSGGFHLNLNGTSGRVEIDDVAGGFSTNALQNTPGATLFTDFKLGATTNDGGRILYFSTGTNQNAARAEIRIDDLGGDSYSFRAGGRAADSNNFQSLTSSAVSIGEDEWHSLAAVFDYANEDMQIYFDGDLIGTGPATAWSGGATSDTPSDVAFVGVNGAMDGFFLGDIDNTRIFNEALDQEAIQAISLPVPEPGTLMMFALLGAAAFAGELLRRRRLTR